MLFLMRGLLLTDARLHIASCAPIKRYGFARYIDLLRTALNPAEAGRGLYFSYGADITLTQQRWAEAGEKAGKLLGKRAEPRFFWNRHLLASFTGADLALQPHL